MANSVSVELFSYDPSLLLVEWCGLLVKGVNRRVEVLSSLAASALCSVLNYGRSVVIDARV